MFIPDTEWFVPLKQVLTFMAKAIRMAKKLEMKVQTPPKLMFLNIV